MQPHPAFIEHSVKRELSSGRGGNLFASIAFVVGLGIASAQAMPITPIHDTGTVTHVGWRCGGPGWHMNPWGRCVPNRGYYGARRYYGPRPSYGPRAYYGWRRW
jgi:hypothetical protein